MPERATEIRTCAESLLTPGVCCTDGCTVAAQYATVDTDLVEHTRCIDHAADQIAHKPLVYRPAWAPPEERP